MNLAATTHPQAFTPVLLGNGDVHVWCMATDNSLLDHQQDRIRAILLRHECELEARFRFARDRQSFLLTRALVRNALSAYTGVSPSDLRFQRNAYGKPELVTSQNAERLSFNVSHTEGLIALALTRGGKVGVDAEKICFRSAWLELAERFFAPAEISSLREVCASEVPTTFLRLWTLKESYVKARGVGLSVPLNEFTFRWDRITGVIAFQAPLADRASTWKFWQLSNESHFLSICAERVAGTHQQLLVRNVTSEWHYAETNMALIGESGPE